AWRMKTSARCRLNSLIVHLLQRGESAQVGPQGSQQALTNVGAQAADLAQRQSPVEDSTVQADQLGGAVVRGARVARRQWQGLPVAGSALIDAQVVQRHRRQRQAFAVCRIAA